MSRERFPAGSVNRRVEERLVEFSRLRQAFAQDAQQKKTRKRSGLPNRRGSTAGTPTSGTSRTE
ncbi:MAG: hypothetical protein R3F37_18725 [Candidatus Competibacteraceae bacterium]